MKTYKNINHTLKKLDTPYNHDCLKSINNRFKDMTLEDTPQEKLFIQQELAYFNVLLPAYIKP